MLSHWLPTQWSVTHPCMCGNCSCGDCGVTCGAGQTCCNGLCADLTNDPANCGACGFKCATIPGVQTATCQNSAFCPQWLFEFAFLVRRVNQA